MEAAMEVCDDPCGVVEVDSVALKPVATTPARGRPPVLAFKDGDGFQQCMSFMLAELPRMPRLTEAGRTLIPSASASKARRDVKAIYDAVLLDDSYVQQRRASTKRMIDEKLGPLGPPGVMKPACLTDVQSRSWGASVDLLIAYDGGDFACTALLELLIESVSKHQLDVAGTHRVVHHDLSLYEGVDSPASPTAVGYYEALVRRGSIAERICASVVGVLRMHSIHQSVLSPVALRESVMYITTAFLIRSDGTEHVYAAVLDGLLARPECSHECHADYYERYHPATEASCNKPAASQTASGRNVLTYHAALNTCLHTRMCALASGHDSTCCQHVWLLELLFCAYRQFLCACMGYTPPSVWSVVWSGPYAGNVHGTTWLRKRAATFGLEASDVCYMDCPSISVSGKLRSSSESINATQLNAWLYECAVKSLVEAGALGSVRDAPGRKILHATLHEYIPECQWVLDRTALRYRCASAQAELVGATHRDTVIVCDCDGATWVTVQYCVMDESSSIHPELAEALLEREWGGKGLGNPLVGTGNTPMQSGLPHVAIQVVETESAGRGHQGDMRGVVMYHSLLLSGVRRALLAFHKSSRGGEGHFQGLGKTPDGSARVWYTPPTAAGFTAYAAGCMARFAKQQATTTLVTQDAPLVYLESCLPSKHMRCVVTGGTSVSSIVAVSNVVMPATQERSRKRALLTGGGRRLSIRDHTSCGL